MIAQRHIASLIIRKSLVLTFAMFIVSLLFPIFSIAQGPHKSLIEIRDSLNTDMQTVKNQVGIASPLFAKTLNDLAKAEADLGNFDIARRFVEQALEIYQNRGDQLEYTKTLSNLSWCNSNLGRYAVADSLEQIALSYYVELVGRESPLYAKSLSNLAWCESNLGRFNKAIEYDQEALNVYSSLGISKECAKSLCNLAEYQIHSGHWEEGRDLAKKSLEIRRSVLPEGHSDIAKSLSILAWGEFMLGNYQAAFFYEQECMNIRKLIYGINHPSYANSLSNMAWYKFSVGEWDESIQYEKEALQIREETYNDQHHPEIVNSYLNLSEAEARLGNTAQALEYIKSARRLTEEAGASDPNKYAAILSDNALFESYAGNYDSAIAIEKEAIQILKRLFGSAHPAIANSLSNMAGYYSALEDYNKALSLQREALNIIVPTLGKDSEFYERILSGMADYELYLNDLDNAIPHRIEHFYLVKSILLRNFASMTSSRRKMFWKRYEELISNAVPYLAFMNPLPEMVSCSYDASLLSKGLLLQTEQELNNLIMESGDSILINKFYRITDLTRLFNEQLNLNVNERIVDIDSLKTEILNAQEQMIRKSRVYGDFTKGFAISWKDIKDNLPHNSMAIEFQEIEIAKDSTIYCALLLRQDMEVPKLIRLFDGQLMDKYINKEDIINNVNNGLFELVWSPIEPYVSDGDTIFFSPAGQLHELPLEAASDKTGVIAYNKWNLYRLSSTREVVPYIKNRRFASAVLYGGLNYDADLSSVAESLSDNNHSSNSGSAVRSLSSTRGTMDALPHTLEEVELIAEQLSSIPDLTVCKYVDNDGTEESFYALSGASPDLLHIATHGFFHTLDDLIDIRSEQDKYRFMILDDNSNYFFEDPAMTQSGITLSGANIALSGKEVPSGREDGVLTALEISFVRLDNCDLVVLSACETGLGKVGSEGVFGLQRGFKKAGAKSILMSLWDVNDEATSLLMNKFYEEFLRTGDKRRSLFNAQQYIRQCSERYSNPEFWAGWVLLDAI